MREVLFKAKRLSNAEWVEGYYIGPVGVLNVHEICDIHDIAGTRVEVDPSTVCQYTGQVDYESEEPIFCDDLLKSQNGMEHTYVVGFEDGGYFAREHGETGIGTPPHD